MNCLNKKDLELGKFKNDICEATYNGEYIWRIENFRKQRMDARTGRIISFYSPSFYVGHYGYHMRVRAYLNGDGSGKHTHLAIFAVIMNGAFDDILKWPFKQTIRITLLDVNSEGRREDIVDSFTPSGDNDCFKKPVTQMNVAAGIPLFAPFEKLECEDSKYVKHDSIYVKLSVSTKNLHWM